MRMTSSVGAGLAGLALMVGCVPLSEEVPRGQAYVELGDGGVFSGSTRFRIYANGQVSTYSSEPLKTGTTALTAPGDPAGYDAVRKTALSGIADLGPVPDEACADYGTDYLVVSDGTAHVAEVYSSCPNEGVTALLTAVRGAYAKALAR